MLHDLQTVKAEVSAGNFEVVTSTARRDIKELGWRSEHVIALVRLLNIDRHYHKSPLAQQTDWGPLDCDQYRIFIVEQWRDEDHDPATDPLIREARRHEPGLEIFVKLSLDDAMMPAVGIVSAHTSR